MQVQVYAGSFAPVDTAQVYLEFDPDRLQVETIAPGPRLEYLLQSAWDNKTGNLAYAAGALAPAAESRFTLCTVTFRATADTGETTTRIGFTVSPNIHRTKVVHRGLDITGQLLPLEMKIR